MCIHFNVATTQYLINEMKSIKNALGNSSISKNKTVYVMLSVCSNRVRIKLLQKLVNRFNLLHLIISYVKFLFGSIQFTVREKEDLFQH